MSSNLDLDRGAVRHSQLITTFGVGALVDLPKHSAIVAGLEHWIPDSKEGFREIVEPRLSRKLAKFGAGANPKLYAPPAGRDYPPRSGGCVRAFRFPTWFVAQDPGAGRGSGDSSRDRSRALVPAEQLDPQGRYGGKRVVATRFVRACPRGHLDDIAWWDFVHQREDSCRGPLSLRERGTTGDLSDLRVVCSCGKSRSLADAKEIAKKPLGTCSGRRPWLGAHSSETCALPARLLIRTATNAWFPQIVSVLSLPDSGTELDRIVADLWSELRIVEEAAELTFIRKKEEVAAALSGFPDDDVLAAILRRRDGKGPDRPVRLAELDALLAVPEGFGEDVPLDPNFHARALPEAAWVRLRRFRGLVARVVQAHRLREVMALGGFTRFEAALPGPDGDYEETDVERAGLAREPSWFPAVESRGEGIFLELDPEAVRAWKGRAAVRDRTRQLTEGQRRWNEARKRSRAASHTSNRPFPGGPYVLLHTLAHLLLGSLALRCGYPAASIRERIYLDEEGGRYGLLLYTASADAEGTLGGLVQQARHIENHLESALEGAALCSNDPICAHHAAGQSREERWLHGAACHGCALIAETSCEMRNDYLDRALVAPVIGRRDAAFFPE